MQFIKCNTEAFSQCGRPIKAVIQARPFLKQWAEVGTGRIWKERTWDAPFFPFPTLAVSMALASPVLWLEDLWEFSSGPWAKVDSVPLAWKHPGGHVLSPQLPHLPCPLSLEGWDTHGRKGFGEPALLGGL